MALILLLETATSVCSVAVAEDGKLLAIHEESEKNIHATHLTLFIENVMQQAGRSLSDLDAIAVSMGPGSYTGLRIGVSTAKGLCYAMDKPLIGINTLESMAAVIANSSTSLYVPMIDARRMEVYTAVYDADLKEILPTQAMILDEQSFAALSGDLVI